MDESILTSIKKLLGIPESQIGFDPDIIIHINSVMIILMQLGVGPESGFSILDKSSTWVDFLGSVTNLAMVKSYIYLKVKLIFDPPQASTVLTSMENNIKEYESRLMIQAELNLPVTSVPVEEN